MFLNRINVTTYKRGPKWQEMTHLKAKIYQIPPGFSMIALPIYELALKQPRNDEALRRSVAV